MRGLEWDYVLLLLYFFQATKLDPINKKLVLDSGAEISYDKCLLATGGKPRNLPVFSEAPAELQDKVSLYRTIPDYLKMDELVSSVGSILVIGGGFLGSELAVGMAHRGEDVAEAMLGMMTCLMSKRLRC